MRWRVVGLVAALGWGACGDEAREAGPDVAMTADVQPDAEAPETATGDVEGPQTAGPDVNVAEVTVEDVLTDDATLDAASDAVPDATSDAATVDATAPPDAVEPPKNALGETLTFELEPFTVAPGTERQVCKTVNLPAGGPYDVVRFRSNMAGTSHHLNVYKVIDDKALTPASAQEGALHDCQPADEQLSGDAAYIFGSATPVRVMDTPEGVAFHLEPGQRLILEQHVLNYTLEPAQGGATVELVVAAEPEAIAHHADIIWFATWNFMLMPGQETVKTTHCEVPYAVEVFGLMSHFHERGTHFEIAKWTPGGATSVYEDDDWAHPKFQTYDPPLTLEAGEGLEWTCTWYLPPGSPLVFPGKNATDEMCITFAAAYPRDSLSGAPIQCNKGF